MRVQRIQNFVAVAAALVCGSVAAQSSQSFIGPSLGIAASAQANKAPLSGQVTAINGQSLSANDTAASLLGSWGFSLSDRWIATVGLSWDLNNTNIGKINYAGTASLSAKSKEHLSMSIAPGYQVANNVLLYGKLAYHQLKAEYTDTNQILSSSASINYGGMGYGLGLAMATTDKTELRAEYETVKYNEQTVGLTTGKPEQGIFMIGLLYRF